MLQLRESPFLCSETDFHLFQPFSALCGRNSLLARNISEKISSSKKLVPHVGATNIFFGLFNITLFLLIKYLDLNGLIFFLKKLFRS